MSALSLEHRRLLAGYRMPAEWEPHSATYLAWPHNRDTWPGKFDVIPEAYARMASALASFEPVRILVARADEMEGVRALLSGAQAKRIELAYIPTNDSWVRDYGPVFVNRTEAGGAPPVQLALDWMFNSWGEKYGAFELDDAVPRKLAERYGFCAVEPGIVLEGGSIDVNGAGTLIATESCLLNPNRNGTLGRGEIEDYLKSCLGVTNIVWLGEGIAGDDTDGHVDNLARFVARDMIVTVLEEDPADRNYGPLHDNLRRLRTARDERGRPFKIATLPMPPPLFYEDSRLPASYANFYIANDGLLVPTFDCPSDSVALSTLSRLFRGRRVVGVGSVDLSWGLGSVHCLTQQHPKPPACPPLLGT